MKKILYLLTLKISGEQKVRKLGIRKFQESNRFEGNCFSVLMRAPSFCRTRRLEKEHRLFSIWRKRAAVLVWLHRVACEPHGAREKKKRRIVREPRETGAGGIERGSEGRCTRGLGRGGKE